MRFERFHFALIWVCVLLGAGVGRALAGTEGAIGGMVAGTMVGLMIATSLLDTE
ncbi:hypothetical protein G3A43_43715 [Paraburkholderia aspalathi]|uniref:hypothetical protein n=1 Tax=Paraburkholderia nemoris TaxID=2793076 RepID=UPI00190BAB1D|nr:MULTISPECIES: hypothetical protein [Paraburkholderia]MBK3787076.1 hypothetical protein [Paraburkholderia aspalathi]